MVEEGQGVQAHHGYEQERADTAIPHMGPLFQPAWLQRLMGGGLACVCVRVYVSMCVFEAWSQNIYV